MHFVHLFCKASVAAVKESGIQVKLVMSSLKMHRGTLENLFCSSCWGFGRPQMKTAAHIFLFLILFIGTGERIKNGLELKSWSEDETTFYIAVNFFDSWTSVWRPQSLLPCSYVCCVYCVCFVCLAGPWLGGTGCHRANWEHLATVPKLSPPAETPVCWSLHPSPSSDAFFCFTLTTYATFMHSHKALILTHCNYHCDSF